MHCLPGPLQTSSSAACVQPRSACLPGWPAAAAATGQVQCASLALHHTLHFHFELTASCVQRYHGGDHAPCGRMLLQWPVQLYLLTIFIVSCEIAAAHCRSHHAWQSSHRGCETTATATLNWIGWRHNQVAGQHLLKPKLGGGGWATQAGGGREGGGMGF